MATILTCPRCERTLAPQRVTVEGRPVVVDICARGCGGVWLDDTDTRSGLDASDDLFEVVPETPPAPVVDRRAPVACPVCRKTMDRLRWNYQSPVLLDHCPEGHGTWIDGGEVREMEAWETNQALDEPLRASVMARVHLARLEAATGMMPDERDNLGNPVVNALQNLYQKLI